MVGSAVAISTFSFSVSLGKGFGCDRNIHSGW